MTRTPPADATTTRRIHRLLAVGLLAVLAALTAVHGRQMLNFLSPSAALPSNSLHREHRGALGEAGGAVPEGVTVFEEQLPAVAHLDHDLLKALRRAAKVAADDEVEFYVNSGWRSPAYQNQLLRKAVAKYGSQAEAVRWVATAATSPHVSGKAVDIGRDATAWLAGHGAAYGLCQIYRNEAWHYELRPEAIDHGCPRMYADPTQDPRMQQ
jgi:hypothetical protein